MPHLLQLLLLLVVIVLSAKAAGALSVRYGQPAVFGEILIGLLLGPTFLDLLHLGPFAGSGETLHSSLRDLSEIGVILLMFVAGLETDLDEMKRVGRVAFWAALGGVVAPLIFGALGSRLFGYGWRESIFIGTVLTATSVSISAQTLMELRQLRSKEGSTILGAAVIDDVMGIILLSFVVALSSTGAATTSPTLPQMIVRTLFFQSKALEIALVVLLMAIFFIAASWFGTRYFERILAKARSMPASQSLLAITVSLALLYAFLAQFIGQVAAITGSYLAGVLFGRTRFKKEIDEGIQPLTYSILVPVFFISIGLEADGRALVGESGQIWLMVTILGIAIITKAIGCLVPAMLCGFSRLEALRVGIGMISRGEVGLIVAGVGLAGGVINHDIFSIMVIMVLVTTMITPILLRWVFPRVREEIGVPVFESVAGVEKD